MKFKKEDTVQIIAGKDKGKRGKIQTVFPKDGRVAIEGLNFISRHVRPRPDIRQAGIVQKEAPMNISKVMIVCVHCDKAVRISHKFLDDGKKVRVCGSCREVID